MTPNATCKILAFATTASGTGGLTRTWAETEGEALRCRMTQASVNTTGTVLGEIGPQLYHCAVKSSLLVRPGWRVEIMLDTETESSAYTVRDSRIRFGHLHLLVERA
jgi:hypothetical protein